MIDTGCFHILAIVNSAAMNRCVHNHFKLVLLSFLCKHPDVEMLDNTRLWFFQ